MKKVDNTFRLYDCTNKFIGLYTYIIEDKEFSKTHTPNSEHEYCPESINSKIAAHYFKDEPIIKVYAKNFISKIKSLLAYNKQLALPVGKHAEEVDKKKNEN